MRPPGPAEREQALDQPEEALDESGRPQRWSRRVALASIGGSIFTLGMGAAGSLAYAATDRPTVASHGGGPIPGGPGEPPLGAINIRDYGAVGNGITDDSVAIQRALNAARTTEVNVVMVPPGTYLVDATLTAQAPIRIVGVGGWSGSVLVFSENLATGLRFEQPTTAVVIPGPAMQLVNLCLQYGGTGVGVVFDESGLVSPFQDTLVSGCRFQLTGPGTALSSINQRDPVITSCQFLGANASSGVGVELNDTDNAQIENNVFYNLRYGVYGVRGARRRFDAGCVFTGNTMYGFSKALYFNGWELVQAIGNVVDGGNDNCFHLVDCYHSIIAENYLGINGTDYGLLIETQQPYGVGFLGQITVRGNYLNHYSGTSGLPTIGVLGASATLPEDQVTIEGNIVNGYPDSGGIYLHNTQNIIVSMNTFSRAASKATDAVCILDDTPGHNYIFNNLVDAPVEALGDYVENNFTRVAYPT